MKSLRNIVVVCAALALALPSIAMARGGHSGSHGGAKSSSHDGGHSSGHSSRSHHGSRLHSGAASATRIARHTVRSVERETYGERAVLFVNYRGYGQSGGKPTESGLVSDAIELYDWARAHDGIDPQRIALHGRSLGSGVAVQLAASRPVRCVILTTPFSSALDVAREVYPWLPVAVLMRHPFESARRAPSIHVPALFLTGGADTLIPKRHAERLASVWGGSVEHISFDGFGHNDIDLAPRYVQAIHTFLDRHL